MTGLLNKKLSGVLLKLAGISLGERMADVDNRRWSALLKQIKEYETVVTASNPYENAQICCGGVDTREVWPDTLESRLVPGLYLVGELLDVDGICGGYNLQWAWSSGALAGMDAAGGQKRYEKGPEMTPRRPKAGKKPGASQKKTGRGKS